MYRYKKRCINDFNLLLKGNHLFSKFKNKGLVFSALTISGAVVLSQPANASGDWYCGSNFTLDNRSYNDCQINFPTLDTGNDTQTNLYLLLADKGLIDFSVPKTNNTISFYDYSFPINLDTLRHTAFNKIKNPKQSFLKSSEKNIYAEYCNSFKTGKSELQDALELDHKLTSNERKQLMQFRSAIRSECTESDYDADKTKENPPTFPLKWSVNAQPYADYIMASQLFYLGNKSDFYSAQTLYRGLTDIETSNNKGLSWLVDTTNYMLIRTGLNIIYQQGREEYSYQYSKVDPRFFDATQKAIDNYLKNFKNGRYVPSARGLQRRLFWLSEQKPELINEIEWQINNPKSSQFNLNSRLLPEEIERKVFFSSYTKKLDINLLNDPVLLTSFALFKLRPYRKYYNDNPLTLSELQRLKPKFKKHQEHFNYLLATYYFVQENNPQRALDYLPSKLPKGTLSYLEFSQYVLKARAFMELGKTNEANALWYHLHSLPKKPYQNTVTELALALQAERSQNYEDIFGPVANVQSEPIKMQIIRYSASPSLLEQISNAHSATNRLGAEARYALLTKSLLHGMYADFIKYKNNHLPKNFADFKGYDSDDEDLQYLAKLSFFDWQGQKISSNINCPDLTSIVSRLSKKPNDRLQKICLSQFMYKTNLSEYTRDYFKDNYKDNYLTETPKSGYKYSYLGENPTGFKGQQINRLDIYKSVFSGNYNDELSAYALHRAIGCFASSGNNHCSDEEVDISVRKAWFRRLKSDFKHTSWARNQKYYW